MSLKRQENSSTSAAARQKADFSRDLSLLIRRADTRTTLIIRLITETGIQLKELANLKKKSLKGRELRLPQRTATISPTLTRQLAHHARTHASEYVFSSRQSETLTTRRIEQLIATAANKAGTKQTARTLRKAYLQAAAKAAKDDEHLQKLTGLKTATKTRALAEDEQERVGKELKKRPARDQALVRVLLETKKSLKEALTITREDIPRLAISPRLESLLRTLAKKSEEHVFKSRQGATLTTRRAEQIISSIGSKAKVELTSNRLRRSGGAP